MSDEQAPAEVVDSPPAGPEGIPGDDHQEAAPENWEQRFKDTQAYATQKAQEASENLRKAEEAAYYQQVVEAFHGDDADLRKQAAEILGVELPDDETADPNDELARRLERIEQSLTAKESEAQQQAEFQRDIGVVNTGLESLKEKIGRDLTDHECRLLGDAAMARRTDQGVPDITSVIEDYTGIRVHEQKSWAQTKRAPHVSAVGQAGTQAPDLEKMSRSELAAWMASQVQLDDS